MGFPPSLMVTHVRLNPKQKDPPMVQVILNGAAIGQLSEANTRTFLNATTMTVVSQTASTLCLVA
jgi:hypothetical protein